MLYRVPPPPPPPPNKKQKLLTDHKTRGFCSIINFSFNVDTKDFDLEFETKFAQIGYEVCEIHRFKDSQADFQFQNFAGVSVFTMRVHGITSNHEEIFAEY